MNNLTILLHTSKTMRTPSWHGEPPRTPLLANKAAELAAYVRTLRPRQLQDVMHISAPLAAKTHAVLAAWPADAAQSSLAIDSFVGDIYSGLRASTLTAADRDYANQHLRILSGLYGILCPYDAVRPYRLEMGYKLPDAPYNNLYHFWNTTIADQLPASGLIINLAAVEYTKAVLPYVDAARVVTPRFLTADPKTDEPGFVVVHTKIARGAFARWLITTRTTDPVQFHAFDDIGYVYIPALSSPTEPVFVCRKFGGIGLSMRLTK